MSINIKTQQTVIDALSMDCRNHRKTVLCHTPSGVRTDAELFISSQDRLAELFAGEVGSPPKKPPIWPLPFGTEWVSS